MSDITLLRYAVATEPNPLQVSSQAAIDVVVDAPSGYSDDPKQDYVDVTAIVFDFGTMGKAGENLTTLDGKSISVTGPENWSFTIEGLQFTFEPPKPPLSNARIFPVTRLEFRFAGIQVNDIPGVAHLSIHELASSPGDPTQPNDFPKHPKQMRERVQDLGKFPKAFFVDEPILDHPEVNAGGSATISWRGSPAAYELSFDDRSITAHGGGQPLKAVDRFPDPDLGDPPFAFEKETTLTLTVSYVPAAGLNPIRLQRQRTVTVNFPAAQVDSFTVTPDFANDGSRHPVAATLEWKTSHGGGDTPVTLHAVPPLSSVELEDNANNSVLFLTALAPSGKATFNFRQGHTFTVSVHGKPGRKHATATASLIMLSIPDRFFPSASLPFHMAFSPDGRFAFVAYSKPLMPGDAIGVLEVNPQASPGGWTPAMLVGDSSCTGVAVSPNGRYAFGATTEGVRVIEIVSGVAPSAWKVTTIPIAMAPTFILVTGIAVSPDGKRLLMNTGDRTAVFAIDETKVPAAWQVAYYPHGLASIVFTPDGKRVLAATWSSTEPGPLTVLEVSDPIPANWKTSVVPGGNIQSVALTPDGRRAIVAVGTNLSTIDLSRTADPAAWILEVVHAGLTPRSVAITPDGRFAFANCAYLVAKGDLIAFRIESGIPPDKWESLPVVVSMTNVYNFTVISPDGGYVFVPSASSAIQPIALSPPARASSPAPA